MRCCLPAVLKASGGRFLCGTGCSLLSPVLTHFLDEFPQLYSIGFQENRSLAYVIAVKRIVDYVVSGL
jgi:hypothetical protein